MPEETPKVIVNKYGFYEVENKPSAEDLSNYYEEKYYQQSKGSYQKKYTIEEEAFFISRLQRKYETLNRLLIEKFSGQDMRFLDVGAGEGWALQFFKSKGFNVTGIDYSSAGMELQNPELISELIVGDIYEQLNLMIDRNLPFDIIQLDNVLEHVLDPYQLIMDVSGLLNSKESVLIIEVPNDFSILQRKLIEKGEIDKKYWLTYPDHLSYFNKSGLENLLKDCGFDLEELSTDFPIDFALLNPETNYTKEKSKGHNVHLQRVAIENLLAEISISKTNKIYSNFAEMGIGRNIIGYFKLEK